MKNSITILVTFIFISVTISCAQKTNKENCHLKTTENRLTIEFAEGNAQSIQFSPFEKNKIFVKFQNSNHSMIEFDLVTRDTQILRHNHWNKIYPKSTSFFHDKKDSLVWVGLPNRALLRYDQKKKKAKYFSLKYVKRTVSYGLKTYFVAHSGLYVKESVSEEIKKVDGIPLKYIQRVQLLDEKTLILDSKITYDLETETWKEGIQLYNRNHTGKFYSFMAKDGIGIFSENGKLFYSSPLGIKELRIKNRLSVGNIKIDYPYIYGKRKDSIDRYDVQTEALVSFEYRLPKVNNYSPNFRYDDGFIWIYRPGQLYFINTATKESYNFPIQEKERFKSIIYDDCHVYLLYEKRLVVMKKSEFIEDCPIFSITDYLTEFQNYEKFVDSTGIRKEQSEYEALLKLKSIKERYANSTHPEILEHIGYLNTNAFQSVKYETLADCQGCYENEDLPKEQRINCYKNLINREVFRSNFIQVLKSKEDFNRVFESSELEELAYFQSNIDSIGAYISFYDRIGQTDISVDSMAYHRAIALNKICNTSFFCHEGCGGCDYGLVIKALKKFNSEYPDSPLRDNSEFALIGYRYAYDEGFGAQELLDFEMFKNKFPDSDLLKEADFRILSNRFYSMDEKNKIGFKEKLEAYRKSYPNDPRIKEVSRWIRKLKK